MPKDPYPGPFDYDPTLGQWSLPNDPLNPFGLPDDTPDECFPHMENPVVDDTPNQPTKICTSPKKAYVQVNELTIDEVQDVFNMLTDAGYKVQVDWY